MYIYISVYHNTLEDLDVYWEVDNTGKKESYILWSSIHDVYLNNIVIIMV